MFKKISVIEPVNLVSSAEEKLKSFADDVVMYSDVPKGKAEIIRRIGGADAVLLSWTTTLNKEILEQCPSVKYIGMCCSLYSPESANVDIKYANEHGIDVRGIRDYGDEGVVEYVISELVRLLHGFGTDKDGKQAVPWSGIAREITGMKAGIIGLGKSGGMIADALSFFGADISYYSRTEKQAAAEKGWKYLPLKDVLSASEAVFTCLNKNTILLHEDEFKAFGNRKILFNTGLSPSWDEKPFLEWLNGDNRFFCDTQAACGSSEALSHPHVQCMNVSTGRTSQAFDRLSEKVIANISAYISEHNR